ncbi:cytochrome c biogenesis protein CcdA [Fluviicola sp.]|uniref:protein-disulfide reductase DsbD family protein n=1 Tax=Fluviicola sp. TaxID=1917219 RepID=UPI00262FD6DF|nr:cytochrome c biogenesis protein CcdA [Fluviicola sp.]
MVKWKFSVEQGDKCQSTIVAEVTVVPGWEINALFLPKGSFGIATNFDVLPSKEFKLVGKQTEPKPILHHDEESDEDLAYHIGTVKFRQKIEVLSDKDFKVKIKYGYQTCKVNSYCLAPFESTASVTVKGCKTADGKLGLEVVGEENTASANNSKQPDNNNEIDQSKNKKGASIQKESKPANENELEKKSMLEVFLISFGSGLLALITPCMFPMIPMTVSFFTKRSKDRKTGIKNAFLYGLSIILIYVVLGTVVTAVTKDSQAINNISSNPYLNLFFFALLVVFAISFLGAFEIRLPAKWVNSADAKADKGGVVGIFFMALVLALVSFSCTGPFVGNLLVVAVEKGGIAPIIGMIGFSSAIALPFALFALFPSWLNSLPQSGGWLNTVKVVLGLLELAFAFKFLSNADFTWQAHILEREVFIAIWIGIFLVLSLYLFGFFRFPHDDAIEKVSVGRGIFGIFTLSFVFYMLPGLWGAPLKLINAFPPPQYYSESPRGLLGESTKPEGEQTFIEGMELGPQGLNVFHDFDLALAHSKKVGKPLFVDFTGYTCVNCRKMEESVWGEPGVIEHLTKDVVIVSLHTDDRKKLPKNEQVKVELVPGKFKTLRTYGDKWGYMEIKEFNVSAQPYYIMYDENGKPMHNVGAATYDTHKDPSEFKKWLENGLDSYKK